MKDSPTMEKHYILYSGDNGSTTGTHFDARKNNEDKVATREKITRRQMGNQDVQTGLNKRGL